MSARADALAHLRALLDGGATKRDELLAAVGAAARVSSGDPEDADAALLSDDADALILRARALRGADAIAIESVTLPATPELARWLSDPRGPFSGALAELEHVGALAAALVALAPEGAAATNAALRIASLAEEIASTARSHGPVLLEAALAAAGRIATHGVDLPSDAALVALADVVGARLDAALAGEPLEAPSPLRVAVLEPAHARALGSMLAKALGRATLDVSRDMLEIALPPPGHARARELVLHGAEAAALLPPPPVELLRGVHVTLDHGELVASVRDRGAAPILLVPLERGEPGRPCASRGGARAGETVFTLSARTRDLDGYVLVVGERIAFVRVR